MNNSIYINGQNFTDWASGLDNLTESWGLKDDGSIEIGQSSQVVLTGDGYDYWYNEIFLNSCNSINNEYDVRINIQDCGIKLDYILKAQGISIDPVECKVTFNLNYKDTRGEATEWLKKSYFWDYEFGFVQWALGLGRIPKMLWVNEMTVLSKVIATIYFIIIEPLLLVVEFIIDIINIIIEIINTLPGVSVNKIKKTFFDRLDDDVIGAGEYTTVSYVYDILSYWAGKAGLTFKSSIFETDPYNNTVLFGKQYDKGFERDTINVNHFDEANAPNMSALELLNELEPVFNAEWKIIDDILYFERKDFYDSLKQVVFNLESEVKNGRVKDGWSYTFDSAKNCARFLGEFAYDNIDTQGNRAMEFYRKNVDYNSGLIHKNRRGDCQPRINFSPVRCTEDKYRDEKQSIWWFTRGGGGFQYTHSIVLSMTYASNFKLLCLDKNFKYHYKGDQFRYVCKEQLEPPANNYHEDFPDLTGLYEYNRPFWFSELYDKFHYIEDPDLKLTKFVEIRSLTWTPDNFCDAVNFLHANKLNIKINSKYGPGNVEGGFVINYGLCSIDFQNIKFKCIE